MTASSAATPTTPTRKQIKRWQRYLANERAEAAVYRELALKKQGEEREILLGIAEAEARHEEHWRTLLGDHVGMPRRPDYSTLLMGFLAKRFGSVFTLALMQSAEARTPYEKDDDATDQMTADERIHAEVVRGLAAKSREKMSGNFRAAVFGANDGLVSNLALVLGVVGSGVDTSYVLPKGTPRSLRAQPRHRRGASQTGHQRQRTRSGIPRPRHGSRRRRSTCSKGAVQRAGLGCWFWLGGCFRWCAGGGGPPRKR